MAKSASRDICADKLQFSRKLEIAAEQASDMNIRACTYEKAAQNSAHAALFGSSPRSRADAKHMAVRQYLYAIHGFIETGDFFRADSNLASLMDLHPRLSRKVRDELGALNKHWEEARRENIVPSIDLSAFRNSLRR